MAVERIDEILGKAVQSDSQAIPRYDLVNPQGTTVLENVSIQLKNPITQPGMPYNKQVVDEILAASGITAGTNTAYTLQQPNFHLFDGAVVRFKLHVDSGATPTLNVNGTGAKALMKDRYGPMPTTFAGTWVTAVYCSDFDFFVLQGSTGTSKGKAGQRYKTISSYLWLYGHAWNNSETHLGMFPYFI